MTELYLVRHCEAQGNLDHIFHGITDTEVTERGKEQLGALAERFKNIPIDIIYASPLKRTVATANAINKYHNCKIIVDDRVIEINGGEIEGMKWTKIRKEYAELGNAFSNDILNFNPQKGESTVAVAQRGYQALMDIVNKNKGKSIAVATHGAFIRMSISLLSGGKIEDIPKIKWMENTGITAVRFDDDFNCEVVCYDDCLHIEESGVELYRPWSKEEVNLDFPLSAKWGHLLGEK